MGRLTLTPEGTNLSQSLWCEPGDHPFSARDPKREQWARRVVIEGSEPPEMAETPWDDVCGPCSAQMRLYLQAPPRHAQAAATPAAQHQPDGHNPPSERFAGLGHEPYGG